MKLALCLASATLLLTVCPAQTLTPQQLSITPRLIADVRFSPDGGRVAMRVIEPAQGTTPSEMHLWELDVRSRQWRQITNAPKVQANPQWSPDGSKLAYYSNTEGRGQLYVMPAGGGDPVRLTDGTSRVANLFAWSPDGRQIAFTVADVTPPPKPADKPDPIVLLSTPPPPSPPAFRLHLWVLDVATKEARAVDVKAEVSEFQWMPSGKDLLVSADVSGKPGICLMSVANGKTSEIASPKGGFSKIDVSPDGKMFSFIGVRQRGPTPHDDYKTQDLFVQPIAGGPARNLTGTSIDRSVVSYKWQRDGSLMALVETGFRHGLYRVSLDGKAELVSNVDGPGGFDACNGKTAFASRENTIGYEELWLCDGNAAAVKVSTFNAEPNQLPMVRPEFVRYKSFDGLEIEGALLLPAHYGTNRRVPLVVIAHGGPVSRWEAKMEPWGQLLAAHGYAVLYPNVRGSTGYGLRFSQMSRGDLGGGDFKDLMTGVDYVIARGIADPGRLGIAGWSYGGEMAAWAITQTQRFKAAFVGAPVVNWLSEVGTEANGPGDMDLLGVPWENFAAYARQSPLTYIKNAKTPTLIAHGEEDTTNPIGQSYELFQALKYYKVESQLVVYPREPHGLREEKHRIDLWTRILDWFDSHLKRAG